MSQTSLEHFNRVNSGAYHLGKRPRPRGLGSYQLNSDVDTFIDCQECQRAGLAAGFTGIFCPDHRLYFYHCLNSEPITAIDWESLEAHEGKAFVERWSRHLG